MTKPMKHTKAKPRRDVLAELEALGDDMRLLAAAFTLKKPDAMAIAAYARDLEARKRDARLKNQGVHQLIVDALNGYDCTPAHQLKAKREGEAAACHHARYKAIVAVMAYYSRLAMTWREDEGMTPEKRVQKTWDRDPILVLLEARRITVRQAGAARHMAWVYESVTAALMPKIGKMESAGRAPGGSWREPTMSADATKAWVNIYLPWIRKALPAHKIPLAFVFAVCVEGHAMRAARDKHRLGWSRSISILRKALDLYADLVEKHSENGRKALTADFPLHLLEHQGLTSPDPEPQHH